MRTRENIEDELKRRVVAQEWTEGMTHHLIIQLLLDIRELLSKQPCPDCCYANHGGEPSEERLRLGR